MSYSINCKLCGGIVLLRAEAGGRKGWFAFDTGAMQTTLNSVYYPDLAGERVDVYKYDSDVTGSAASSGTISHLCLGDTTVERLDILNMDMSYVENALRTQEPDIEFLGSIGIDVIGAHDVLLDYAAKTIALDPETRFDACNEVPLAMEKLPLISCAFGDKSYRFALDTGASACLIGQELAGQLNLRPAEAPPHLCTLPSAVIGDRPYEGLQAVVGDIAAIRGKTGADGVIGYQLLSRQRSVLGFRSGVLRLETIEEQ